MPIVADAEAGFGGALNVYELMKSMIEAGAAGVHFEDQLSSEKKCGHMGGKVLIPTGQHIRTLNAARLAADVAGVPTMIVARTDVARRELLTSDVDPRDQAFITGERTPEGFYYVRPGIDTRSRAALAYAPYADLIWCETSTPTWTRHAIFAEADQGASTRTSCWPTTARRRSTGASTSTTTTIARFQRELGAMGYTFQFVTLAGWHALNESMFQLARGYAKHGMTRLRRTAGARVRPRGAWLHRNPPPA